MLEHIRQVTQYQNSVMASTTQTHCIPGDSDRDLRCNCTGADAISISDDIIHQVYIRTSLRCYLCFKQHEGGEVGTTVIPPVGPATPRNSSRSGQTSILIVVSSRREQHRFSPLSRSKPTLQLGMKTTARRYLVPAVWKVLTQIQNLTNQMQLAQ